MDDWKEWREYCRQKYQEAATKEDVVTMNGQPLIDGLTEAESCYFGTGWFDEERSPILPYVPTKPQRDPRFPQDCTSKRNGVVCGAPAYIGFNTHECTSISCQHYRAK